MDKGSSRRVGKVVTAGHTTRVEGMNRFLDYIEDWPQIKSIRLGRIDFKKSGNYGQAKGGGGFSFRATRLAMAGPIVTGILCRAVNGTCVQLIVLTSDDLDALKSRLQAEGFGANW